MVDELFYGLVPFWGKVYVEFYPPIWIGLGVQLGGLSCEVEFDVEFEGIFEDDLGSEPLPVVDGVVLEF